MGWVRARMGVRSRLNTGKARGWVRARMGVRSREVTPDDSLHHWNMKLSLAGRIMIITITPTTYHSSPWQAGS